MNKMLKTLAVFAVASVALTGCSFSFNEHDGHEEGMGSMMSSDSNQAKLNHADIKFLQGMIPHHQQAVYMATLAETHSTNKQLLELAAGIKSAQTAEIADMTKWLTDDGQSIQEMPGMEMSGMGGMMSDSEMADLTASQGTTFDKLFLTGMIAHHEGALAMAKQIIVNGTDARVRTLATNVLTSQASEMATMKTMLAELK